MTTASIAQPMISYALPDNPAARLATQVGLAILGTLVLVLAAKTKVELGFVDLSLQTLAVFLVGAVYGMRLGVATLLLYMAEGASGVLPVFQGETAGLAYMVGPTGGYLLGFVLAAGIVGWAADRGWDRGVVRFLPMVLLAELAIIVPGFIWLATIIGPEKAWLGGVVPFVVPDLIKVALASVLLPAAWSLRRR
jgi:biotin transport system substrate-specific component